MKKLWRLFLLLFLFFAHNAYGQNTKLLQIKQIRVDSLAIKLDTVSIIPQTFKIFNLDASKYYIDPLAAKIYFKDSSLINKTVSLQYETFEVDFSKAISHKKPPFVEPNRPHHDPVIVPVSSIRSVFEDEQLQTNGSITRGVSLGNNQDVVLNSSLNLQIAGKLSDDIEILASITDKNIPIQPEGNTLNVQDINSVFITLKYKNIALLDAGDIHFENASDNFLRVNREITGLKGMIKSKYSDKFISQNIVGGGLAKGKFNRQALAVQNGMQGPYKLYGANNEPSIAVISGSERVYMDGQLLTRGSEHDYTIDYNTAEITFTPNILVSSEKRFIIEFEYSDRHYVRYNLFTNNEFQFGTKHPTKIFVNFFHEQDMKNQSIQPELTNAHKMFLSQLGDDGLNAHFPVSDTSIYSPNIVQYVKIDTLFNNKIYTIFKYANDSLITLYNPSFTYMGAHKGNYVLSANTANGRVFEWVAPQNDVPQGDYEPVLALVSPISQQMLTIGFSTLLRTNTSVSAEVAMSNYNKNLFSKIDDDDNIGFSYLLKFSDIETFKTKKDTAHWNFNTNISMQFIGKQFTPFESFRNVEFAREYNLANDYSTSNSDLMVNANFALYKSLQHKIAYSFNMLFRPNEVLGIRNELITDNFWKRWHLNTKTSALTTKDSIQNTFYVVSRIALFRNSKFVAFGIDNLLEYNKFAESNTNILRQNSFAFNELNLYLRNSDTLKHNFLIAYKNRNEFLPYQSHFQHNTMINEFKVQYKLPSNKSHSFYTNLTYRNQILDDTLHKKASEHYFIGNISYTGRFLKNSIIFSTYYEVGSGMEKKKAFSYLKVAKGQGTHVWNDYNGNGIEEIDEFEIAAYADEAEYIKVWNMSNEYVNVFINSLTQSLLLRPAALWGNKSGFRKFLARFSNSTNLRTSLKHKTKMFQPFIIYDDGENTVANVFNLSNTLSFNNSNSKFAFDFTVSKTNNTQFLYYGSETNSVELQDVTIKSLPIEQLYLQTFFQHKQTDNKSSLYSRNYLIECYSLRQDIRLQFLNRYITTIYAEYSMKNNLQGIDKINLIQAGLEFSYRWLNRGNVCVTGQYVNILGQCNPNSSASYYMLNGLSVGQNVIWTVDAKFSVSDFLQLSLQYGGRAVPKRPVVHYGNVSISAVF